MEQKDMDIPPDVEEHFPEEIFLSHYVEAWKFIIAFKQERGQRQWWHREQKCYFCCLCT